MKAVITPTMKIHPTTSLQQSLKDSPLQVAILLDYGKNTTLPKKNVRIANGIKHYYDCLLNSRLLNFKTYSFIRFSFCLPFSPITHHTISSLSPELVLQQSCNNLCQFFL